MVPVRLSIQGGHLGHDNNGGIARGATPESSGSYGFVRLEGDLLRTEVAGMSLTTGVYGAAGHSSVDVKDDDGGLGLAGLTGNRSALQYH